MKPTAAVTFDHVRLPSGVRLHVATAGPEDGPMVVLLHGFPEFWYGWRHQIVALAEAGLRVVAPDQRGCNLSDKPAGIAAYRLDTLADDITGLAAAVGRERFAVVGHDWGGVVAWHLAARFPDRVTRAAILNAPHSATLRPYARHHPSQLLKSWYVAFFQLPRLPELALAADGFWVLRRVLRRTSRPGTFSTEDFRHYREAWSRPGALSGSLNWYRALRLGAAPAVRPSQHSGTGHLGRPRRFPRPRGRRSGSRVMRARRGVPPPDATHWVQHEEPAEVNRLLLEFLR